jgi:tetratricopeptide (TPR) repeat protein
MNKAQILDLISNPRPIQKSDAEGLKQVLSAYPYFTAANYLLAKFYHEQDDFQYQQQLKITATQTNNRKSLYKLIHENVPAREQKVEIIIEQKTEIEPSTIHTPEMAESPLNIDVQDVPKSTSNDSTEYVTEPTHEEKKPEFTSGIQEEASPIDVAQSIEEIVSTDIPSSVQHVDEGEPIHETITEEIQEEEKNDTLQDDASESDTENINTSSIYTTAASNDTVESDEIAQSFENTEVIEEEAENLENPSHPIQSMNIEEEDSEMAKIEVVSNTIESAEGYQESEDHDLVEDENGNQIHSDKIIINVKEVVYTTAASTKIESTQVIAATAVPIKKESNKEKTIEEFISVVEANPIKHRVDLNILTNAIEKNLDVNSVASAKPIDDGSEHSFIDWLKKPTIEAASVVDKPEEINAEIILEKQAENFIDPIEKHIEEQAEAPIATAEKVEEIVIEPVTPIETIEETNHAESQLENPSENNPNKTSKLDKAKAFEILDKFIETQPKISKPKVDFYSPVNMAKQSVADHDELATETLATIYMAQGNYLKAIKVYTSLIHKFPEKEAYFKKLIKKAKDRMQPKK